MAKDRAGDPKRVPAISFPLPSTVPPKGREPLRLDIKKSDNYTAGSSNPIIEMMDVDDWVNHRRDDNHPQFGKGQ